ncbi:hypothetical protein ACWDSF_06050 [Nocardia beijingensis]
MSQELITEAQQLAASLPDGTGTLSGLRETQLVRSRLMLIALADALEAKAKQHAETLGYLEQAQRVIERDSAAYGRLLRVLWQSRRAAQEQIDRLRSGGKFLGKAIAELNDIALDATGMHDAIDENRSGDWQAVWENVADLGEDLRAARKRIADLEHTVAHLEAQVQR